MLQEQREQLQLDEAGAQGRRQGLTDAISKLTAQMENRVASDDRARELAKVVEVRQAEFDRMKQLQNTGAIAAGEVGVAEANLADAKTRLVQVRFRKASSNPSTEVLDSWNRQLLELSVTSLERDARLGYLQKRLATLAATLGNVDRLEQLHMQFDEPRQAAKPVAP